MVVRFCLQLLLDMMLQQLEYLTKLNTKLVYIIFTILFDKSVRYISKSFMLLLVKFPFCLFLLHSRCCCCCCAFQPKDVCSLKTLVTQRSPMFSVQCSMCTFYWFPSFHCHLFIHPEDILYFIYTHWRPFARLSIEQQSNILKYF